MAVLDPVDTQNRVGRTVLLVLAVALWGCGWLAGKTLLLLAWTLAALKLGWSDARGMPVRR